MSLKLFFHRLNRRDQPLFPRLSPFFKIILFLLISLASVCFVSSAFAATRNVYKETRDAIKEGGNQSSWLNYALEGNAVSALHVVTGEIPDKVLNGDISNYFPGGLLNTSTQMIASLYTPPASGVQYIADNWNNFLGKPAYAQQGQGFVGLQGILPLWRGFRNITYLLSSLIFIVIGIMIMLRIKISAQAVINIQNAVPQLITTLILITFSYAIAGLLIDAMQLLQSLVVALLFNSAGRNITDTILPNILGTGGYSFNDLSTGGMNTISDLTTRALPIGTLMLWGIIIGTIIGAVFFPSTGGFSLLAIGIVPIIFLLIIGILLLFWMFKFYFGCLKCYITIIFKIIISPLELAMGAFPNSKMGFNTWIWDLLSNLAVFPISMLFLILGNLIMDAVATQNLWMPSIIGGASLQHFSFNVLTFGNMSKIVSIGIGLSVVGIMSKLPEMIPQFIFMIKPSPWTAAIGETYKPLKTAWDLPYAAGKQELHDRLSDAADTTNPYRGTAQRAAGTAANVMETLGFAKPKK